MKWGDMTQNMSGTHVLMENELGARDRRACVLATKLGPVYQDIGRFQALLFRVVDFNK